MTASGQLLLELTRKGVTREDAYAMVQPLAMRVWDEGANFRELVAIDTRVTEKLSSEEIEEMFDVEHSSAMSIRYSKGYLGKSSH